MKLLPSFALVMVLAVGQAGYAQTPLAGKRPNIVFILTDDQGYGDISAHGNPVLKTPNLDRLHDEGVRFTDFHVSPTCSPTRSALLTGRHEFKNGVTHTILERERLTPKAVTLAQVLKDAGYTQNMPQTFNLGKVPADVALSRIVNTYDGGGKDELRMTVVADESLQTLLVMTRKFAAQKKLTPLDLPPPPP